MDEQGETVCPICVLDDDTPAAVHDYRTNPPNGALKKAQTNPRERFAEAMEEYHEKVGR